MNPVFEQLKEKLDKCNALQTALTLLQWDIETLAPAHAADQTGKVVGILSDEYFQALINPEVKGLLVQLEQKEQKETLSEVEQAIVRELRRTYDQLETIPRKEYSEFSELTLKSSVIWAKARDEDDFDAFAPFLEEIIGYKRRFAEYRKKDEETLYDILLSDYEPSLSTKDLDEFFSVLKKELVPLIHKVTEKQHTIDKSFNELSYEIDKQKEICDFITDYLGFDKKRGVVAESAHPFTTNLHNKDVRITNHFYENDIISAISSIIHEAGHGIYEMNISDEITQTIVGVGATMAVHESQSRFYENIIGRSEAFWEPIYPELVAKFPEQLGEVSLEVFIKGMNKAVPSLIRVDADELTYPMHIMIRYELEQMLINGEISVAELPAKWNEKYEEYLGVTPYNNAVGVLQDTHWSWGDFGYFASYAVGSAIAAQIYYHMRACMDFDGLLRSGTIQVINDYLSKHIHSHGKVYDMNELLQRMTGETFHPEYYIRYLKEKYEKLYDL